MKNTTIEKLGFVNFKGIREAEIEFNKTITSILGRNGSGKTTIFDGFTWLLFGKDSEDRKVFELKTLDANGVAIPKLSHEVYAVLNVDGVSMKLCRRLKEKWVKRRGSAEEEFTGHEEERLINDVPYSVKDWSEKINEICSEQVFKFITNPLYFSSQSVTVQRSMLLRMAGDISDEEVAFGNDDFQRLLSQMTGKTMDEYKREIASKKRLIKADIEGIPERIDECKRMMPEAHNWLELEGELDGCQKSLTTIEGEMNDKAKAFNEANNARIAKAKVLGEKKVALVNLESKIKSEVQSDYNKRRTEQTNLKNQIASDEVTLANLNRLMSGYETDLKDLKDKHDALVKEWKEINGRTLTFNDKDFVCPTCGRSYDIEDIESKQDEMTANFNKRKADDLAANNQKGQANKKRMGEVEDLIKDTKTKIEKLNEKIEKVKADKLYNEILVAPDATPTIEANEEYKTLKAEIADIEKELAEPVKAAGTEELTERKKQVSDKIDDIKKNLANRETIDKTNDRITELENQLRNKNNELAQLEGIEFTMAAFSKARIEMVESRINGMFSIVKFKMFDQQINGGEVETCEAMVGGVPYSVLNNAGRINAGLDIINAICRFENVTAPIFIDNAEAVNQLLVTQSQMIRLVVTEDDKLIIQ